jgi:hypothetical protein
MMAERRRAKERAAGRARSETAEDRLRSWICSVDPDARVSLEAPGEQREGRGVSVYLLDIAPQPPARGAARPPLQLWLRYLVTTWAEDPSAANRLLVELAYAAMEQTDLELDTTGATAATWTALQAVARPSFVIRVTARRMRTRPAAPPVLHPLRLRPTQVAIVAGLVRGPGGIPLADATVAMPDVAREATTDRHGRFQLTGVPGPPVATHIVVRAKGTETVVKLPKNPARARALVIDIKSLEGANA